MAVLANAKGLIVAGLSFDAATKRYEPQIVPIEWILPERDVVESASIALDRSGHWWVAYDGVQSIWMRRSEGTDGQIRSEAIQVGGPT